MWVVQSAGGPDPWKKDLGTAADKFFSQKYDTSGIDAYTGRTK